MGREDYVNTYAALTTPRVTTGEQSDITDEAQETTPDRQATAEIVEALATLAFPEYHQTEPEEAWVMDRGIQRRRVATQLAGPGLLDYLQQHGLVKIAEIEAHVQQGAQ